MANYVVCPNRDQKIDTAVCLLRCEEKHGCDALKKVPWDALTATAKKIGISPAKLKELEPVIEVGVGDKPPERTPEQTELSSDDCGKGFVTDDNDEPLQKMDVGTQVPAKAEVTPTNGKTKKAMELYERLLVLKKDVNLKLVEMGEVLNEFLGQKYYLDIGYATEEQFCREALGFTARWALDIRKVALLQDKLKLSDREVAEVGVKKMSVMLSVVNSRKDAENWMNKAKEPGVTTEKLVGMVRHFRSGKQDTDGEPEPVPTKYILPVYQDDVETVERAFELAKEITKSDSRGVQFVGICDEFRSTYDHATEDFSKARIVMGMIKSIEGTFKVRIPEIIDLETGEIIGRE